MRTEIVVRSLTDFTGATYLGANLDIRPYGVRSTQWSDFTQPRTDAPVRFAWERCCNLPSCGVTHRRLHSAIAPHFR